VSLTEETQLRRELGLDLLDAEMRAYADVRDDIDALRLDCKQTGLPDAGEPPPIED